MATAVTRLRDTAYSSFTEKLLSRDIQPGQFVSQRELVELTGMPLGAIREMIPRLEADGLIRTAPKRGLQVMSIDVHLIRDAFQLRRMIESEAVALFCRNASDACLATIDSDHRAIREHAGVGVDDTLLNKAQKMDWAFHDMIVDHMDNRIISEIYRVNTIKIRLIANSRTQMLHHLVASVMEEHMPIVDALCARNARKAVTAMQAHIDSARRRALEL